MMLAARYFAEEDLEPISVYRGPIETSFPRYDALISGDKIGNDMPDNDRLEGYGNDMGDDDPIDDTD